MKITKKGEDLLAKTSIHTEEFQKFLLKFELSYKTMPGKSQIKINYTKDLST